MLINRILKKYPGADAEMRDLIKKEVNAFCASEYVTKETIKQLENRVSFCLQQKQVDKSNSYRIKTDTDAKIMTKDREASLDVNMALTNYGTGGQLKYDSYTGHAKTLRR